MDVGAAGKLDLQLVGKPVDLLDELICLNVGRSEGLEADNLGHVFVDDLIGNQLDALEGSLSK